MREGQSYTLVVDSGWKDAAGRTLKESHRKEFQVGPPDYHCPDLETWKLAPPSVATRSPFTIDLPGPLDHALLERLLWVNGPDGETLEGEVEVSRGERRWSFTPTRPWSAGKHHLIVETILEDLAGNSIDRPFEVDVFREIERRIVVRSVKREFEVR